MPTFQDPVVDGEEACHALRALAHATRTFDDPAQTYEVVGDLLGGLRSLEQVLNQLAFAHTSSDAIARTDDGDHWAGVEEAHAAALALRRASTLVARAGLGLFDLGGNCRYQVRRGGCCIDFNTITPTMFGAV